MPRYVKSISFSTSTGTFKPEKDDPQVNDLPRDLQDRGVEIRDIKVAVGGSTVTGVTALYVVEYEAEEPV